MGVRRVPFASLKSPALDPPPVPVAAITAGVGIVHVFFDQALQLLAPQPAVSFPIVVSGLGFGPRRRMQPGCFVQIDAPSPTICRLANVLAPFTTDPSRVQYDPMLGAVLVGTTGVAVEAFDIPVPFP